MADGGGKRRGEAIAMMIAASTMAEVSRMTTRTTKGGAKEKDAVHLLAGSCCRIPSLLVLLLVACLTPCPYHRGGVGGVSGGGGSGRRQSLSKWRGAPASKANADGDGMDEDSEGPKNKI